MLHSCVENTVQPSASSLNEDQTYSLNHELLDNAMEVRSGITIALAAFGELEKVLGSLGDGLRTKLTEWDAIE